MPSATSNISKPLKSIVDRIENLEEEKRGIASDIKDIYSEAKGTGLDVKTIRQVVSLRKLDAAEREEREHLRDVYLKALGLIADDE